MTGLKAFLARPSRPSMEDDATEADVERLKNRLRQLSATWNICRTIEDAFQDWMAWCLDWLQHRMNRLSGITDATAHTGLRNWAYDMCLAARDSTRELKALVRELRERFPREMRPTWL